MKFLIKYYRQFSILLISFLFFNVIGACLNFILEESKNITINSYLTLGLLCVLAVEIFLGYVISKFVNKKLYAFILFIYIFQRDIRLSIDERLPCHTAYRSNLPIILM